MKKSAMTALMLLASFTGTTGGLHAQEVKKNRSLELYSKFKESEYKKFALSGCNGPCRDLNDCSGQLICISCKCNDDPDVGTHICGGSLANFFFSQKRVSIASVNNSNLLVNKYRSFIIK